MPPYRQRTVNVGPIKTGCLEAGAGPDLVLLHGGEYGATAETTWKYNISALAERFHVVAPDLLGYGLTDKIYSFSDPAGFRIAHIGGLLEQMGIRRAFFVGNSAGAGALLRAAVMTPPPLQIEKMVSICGNAGLFKTDAQAALDRYDPSMENMAEIMRLLFHDERWLADELVRERYEASILPGAWETLSAARLRRPGHRGGPDIEGFKRKLSRLEIPFLIMSCEHDRLNPGGWDEQLRAIVRNSRIHRFARSAHEPQIEEAEEFNRVLTEFLIGG